MIEGSAPRAVVLGSVHVDLIATATRLPGPGESVTGGTFTMAPGGKAGNQACQLTRLGVPTAVVSRLGDDLFAAYLRDALECAGVDTSALVTGGDAATGASTVLAGQGDYQSIIAPGAAALLSPDDVDAAFARLDGFGAFVTQLELPVEVTTYAAVRARTLGASVVLNASPAPDDPAAIPAELWERVAILVVNRVEAAALAGVAVGGVADAVGAARALRGRHGLDVVVVTLGSAGAVGIDDGGEVHQPAFPATPVDTVGAGDAFLGAFVAARLEGAEMRPALRWGSAAGALAVGRRGAYDALPTRDAVERVLDERARLV